MVEIGKINNLTVIKSVDFGVYLDGDDLGEILLPEQYTISASDIEDEQGFLIEGLENIVAILLDGNLVAIELPAAVAMTITETTPGIKGATAAARTKPAQLATGLEVQVPEYIETGEVIKINTATGKFMSRA